MTDTVHSPPEAKAPPKRNRTDSYHPAMHGFEGRRMPAGHIWLVVVIALVMAVVFNSGGFLRDANGMRPGVLKTVMIGLATPIDAVIGMRSPASSGTSSAAISWRSRSATSSAPSRSVLVRPTTNSSPPQRAA